MKYKNETAVKKSVEVYFFTRLLKHYKLLNYHNEALAYLIRKHYKTCRKYGIKPGILRLCQKLYNELSPVVDDLII